MTFTEAAIEVLRQVEKPLPFQKISEMAVQQGLLSHVGKTPEATMSQRLAAAVEVPKSALVRVKPGVYGLREWDEGARVPSLKSQRDKEEAERRAREAEEAARARAEREAQREQERAERVAREAREAEERAAREARAAAEQAEREQRAKRDAYERPEAIEASERRFRDGDEAVREDDGSTESAFVSPGLGGPSDPMGAGAGPEGPAEQAPGAGDWGDAAGAPHGEAVPAAESNGGGAGFFDEMATVREEGADEGGEGAQRPGEDEAGGRHGRRRGGRGRRRGRGKASDGAAAVDREADREGRPSVPVSPRATPLREERRTHGVLVEALIQSLRGQERSGGQPVGHIVEQARRRNLLPKDLAEPEASVLAAAVRENAERLRTGRRPRFRVMRDRIGLWDWGLGVEPVRFEDQVEGTARRQRDSTRLALLERLRAMPLAAVGELVTTWLVRSGRTPFRHPSSGDDGVRFLATETRGASTVRLAVEGVRGPVDPDRVEQLARALGEVDAAEGIFIATGDLTPEAQRRLAGGTALRHLHLYDGPSFVRALEEVGVGVQRFSIPLLYLDVELLDALGAA